MIKVIACLVCLFAGSEVVKHVEGSLELFCVYEEKAVCRSTQVIRDESGSLVELVLRGIGNFPAGDVDELQLTRHSCQVLLKTLEFTELKSLKILHSTLHMLNATMFAKLNDLERLMLEGNEITKVSEFQALAKLAKLFLARNKIEVIRAGMLAELDSLKFLTLEQNRIFYIHVEAFEKNLQLEVLNLNRNDLRFLEVSTFAMNRALKDISLNHNKISDLPPEIFQFNQNLEVLRLHNNKMQRLDKKLFDSNFKLIWIELGENRLTFIDPRAFESLTQIEFLDLSLNKCVDESFPIEMNFQHLVQLTSRNCHYLAGFYFEFL